MRNGLKLWTNGNVPDYEARTNRRKAHWPSAVTIQIFDLTSLNKIQKQHAWLSSTIIAFGRSNCTSSCAASPKACVVETPMCPIASEARNLFAGVCECVAISELSIYRFLDFCNFIEISEL